MIDMSPIGAHLKDKVLDDATSKAVYQGVLARRKMIYEARQRGETMPWDRPGVKVNPLNEAEKKELGL